MRLRILPILPIILLLACRRAVPPPAPPRAVPSTATYSLKGTVRSVDPDQGVVTIAHEDIPGFMKAMTMPFTPRDRSNLAELAAGDEVEGPLEVVREGGAIKNYDLLRLEVTNPAPRTLKVDPATGAASLVARPAVLRPGEPVPDFAMTTQDGKPLRLSDLRGNVVVLTFIYTRCPLPDYCPAIDKKFRRLADRLSAVKGRAEGVRLLSVSFDPEHDTPEALRKHAELVGARPPLWTFAVASHAELRKVAERLGLVYGPMPNEIVHNLCTAVVAPDGTLMRLESGTAGKSWDPDDLLRSVLARGKPAG
jgi:protein SCO1/2